MNLTIKTDVTTEPVLAAALRGWLGLDTETQDTMLADIAKAARCKVEKLTGKAICARTYTYTVEMPNYGILELPYPPIQSIVSVKTDNQDGTFTTLAAGDYNLTNNMLGCIAAIGSTVVVEYTTGTTATTEEKQLILKQGAYDYIHRGDGESLPYSPEVVTESKMHTINLGW